MGTAEKSQEIGGKKLKKNRCAGKKVVVYFGQDTSFDKGDGSMEARKRREQIAARLEQSDGPVSATALAREFSVSRQIIVGDVALLRAAGLDIAATPRGYILPAGTSGVRFTVACSHTAQQMEAELNAIVDQGGTVLDVIVEHPIYGQLTAPLRMSSRYEVRQFVERCQQEDAAPLSALTDGVHLHTVNCQDPQCEQRVRQALKAMGILVEG